MIVRSCNWGEVQPGGEGEDVILVSRGRRHSARRTVRYLDAGQTNWTRVLVGWDLDDVSGDGEKEDRWNRTAFSRYSRSFEIGRSKSRSTRIRSKQYRMFITVAKLDTRKKRHAVAGDWRVAFSCIERSIERPVVGDVRRIESGAPVPFAIFLRVKIPSSIVGC